MCFVDAENVHSQAHEVIKLREKAKRNHNIGAFTLARLYRLQAYRIEVAIRNYANYLIRVRQLMDCEDIPF